MVAIDGPDDEGGARGGDRPDFGVRYSVERVGADAQAVTYRGHAHLPSASIALEVRVALPNGATEARVLGEGVADAAELQRAAAALVRAATKSAVASGRALPRKIVRWRG